MTYMHLVFARFIPQSTVPFSSSQSTSCETKILLTNITVTCFSRCATSQSHSSVTRSTTSVSCVWATTLRQRVLLSVTTSLALGETQVTMGHGGTVACVIQIRSSAAGSVTHPLRLLRPLELQVRKKGYWFFMLYEI